MAIGVHRQDEDGCRYFPIVQTPDHVQAAHVREIYVQHQHIGVVLFHQAQGVVAGGPFRHDGDVRGGVHDRAHTGAHDGVIVYDR